MFWNYFIYFTNNVVAKIVFDSGDGVSYDSGDGVSYDSGDGVSYDSGDGVSLPTNVGAANLVSVAVRGTQHVSFEGLAVLSGSSTIDFEAEGELTVMQGSSMIVSGHALGTKNLFGDVSESATGRRRIVGETGFFVDMVKTRDVASLNLAVRPVMRARKCTLEAGATVRLADTLVVNDSPVLEFSELVLRAKSRLLIGPTTGFRAISGGGVVCNVERLVVGAGALLNVRAASNVAKFGAMRRGNAYDESGPGIVHSGGGGGRRRRKRLNPSRTYRGGSLAGMTIKIISGVRALDATIDGVLRIGTGDATSVGADGPLHVANTLTLNKGGVVALNVNEARPRTRRVGALGGDFAAPVREFLDAETDLDSLSTFQDMWISATNLGHAGRVDFAGGEISLEQEGIHKLEQDGVAQMAPPLVFTWDEMPADVSSIKVRVNGKSVPHLRDLAIVAREQKTTLFPAIDERLADQSTPFLVAGPRGLLVWNTGAVSHLNARAGASAGVKETLPDAQVGDQRLSVDDDGAANDDDDGVSLVLIGFVFAMVVCVLLVIGVLVFMLHRKGEQLNAAVAKIHTQNEQQQQQFAAAQQSADFDDDDNENATEMRSRRSSRRRSRRLK